MAQLTEYDPDANERLAPHGPSPSDDDMQQMTGIGADQEAAMDRNALADAESGNLFNRNGDAGEKTTDPAGLDSAESSSGKTGFYNAGGSSGGRFSSIKSKAKKHRKKLFLAGAVSGGIGGIIISLFLLLLPMRVETIVNLLRNRFFSTSEQIAERQVRKTVVRYIVKNVLPEYKNCGTTISKKCKAYANAKGNNPVTNLYRNWSDERFENKLATEYGIEFKYDKAAGKYYLKAPGTGSQGDDIGPNGEKLESTFERSDRTALRNAANDAFERETLYKRIWYRFKVGRLSERKYGIKRCMVFCGTRDALKSTAGAPKKAAKIYLTQRVLVPRNQNLGIAMECLLTGCDPTKTDSSDVDSELNGEPENSETDAKMRASLEELASKYGAENVDEILKTYGSIAEKGYAHYVVAKIFNERAANAIPIVGWMNLAAQLVVTADNAGPAIKKLTYAVNAPAAVALYNEYVTYADEIHTGNVNGDEVGSFADSLNGGDTGEESDPIKGGTASAEDSPLYKSLVKNNTPVAASMSELFAPSTYAASTRLATGGGDYKCNNDKPPKDGELCPEEILGGGIGAANAAHDLLDQPGFNVIATIGHAWQGTIGKAFDLAGGVLGTLISALTAPANAACHLPKLVRGPIPGINVYCPAKDATEAAIPKIAEGVTTALIRNPFSSNMSGGRTFTMMGGGASVGGKDASDQMGSKRVSKAVYMESLDHKLAEDRDEFSHKPMFARMFDSSSQYSLVSNIALGMPSNLRSSTTSNLASSLANPFKLLGAGFGSVFTSPNASAANPADPADADPFKVGTDDFPESEMPDDAEEYWDSHNCGDTSENGPIAKWQKEAADGPKDEDTGMPVHRRTEPCLLIKTVTSTLDAKNDTTALTEDEQQILKGIGGGTGGSEKNSSSEGSLATGNAQDLAKQLQPLIKDGKLFCGPAAGGSGSADCDDIQNTANGNPLGGNCAVKALTPNLLALILGLVKDDGWKLGISAICSNHHAEGDGPYAGHSYGSTADFSVMNGAAGAAAASNEKFVRDASALLSKTGGSFGQTGCHSNYSVLDNDKFTTFGDVCNHQHIRAAP